MVCTETILGKIVEKIVDTVFQSVGRHVGFMLHYKQNLKNLDDEENNLQKQRGSVQGKVNEANHRGEAINNNVLAWLKDADETRQGVDNFRNEKAGKENMLCFNFSCPNFISRYRLSKEAKDKGVHVKHVTEEGGKIENGTVSHPREAPPELEFQSSKDYEGFDSRDKVFTDIVKALKDPKLNRIGVYGTGGVGKTTMVTMVSELVKKEGTFDEVVIAVVSQNANVIKIQGQLAARLKLPLSRGIDDEVGRATQLWNRLDNGKKNLIILDDVWQELDLNKIGIPITDGNKSCKVVLTSRKRDVCMNMDVKDFRIEILSEGESWTLFKKKVGNVDAHHECHEIAWAVCKECQGLPVAINAIGAAMKNKDMNAWEDALDKLKNSMLKDIEGIDRKVYASLKLSYDMLDSEDAKSCFLLCCLFPEDAEIQIDDLVRYYMVGTTFHGDRKPDSLEKALYRVRTVVVTLTSCCLLLEENYNKDVVKMHDIVRDVAISIAKSEKSFLVKHGVKDWPERATYEQCSVISLRPRDMCEFPDEFVFPTLHTLRLDCTENKFRDQVPESFFSGTENLMILDLNSVTMPPILPASLAKLAKLQMLCLDGCKLGDIAILKDLKDHLEILSLRRSDVKVLPREVGELTRLRVLDMDSCKKLQVIPKGVVSKLTRLEELYMPWEFSQWEGTRADGTGRLYMPWEFSQWEETRADGTGRDISRVSLDELMKLTRLTTLLHVRIGDPTLLPKDFTFENLVRFDIAVGKNASYSIYDKDSTGVLQLKKIHVANGLESLLGKPKPKGSIQRNGLYPSTSFYHLTYLSITDCKLKYLFSPSSARGLVQLKKLEIERCMDMEGVIGNEGEEDHEDIISFNRLTYLELNSLPNLKSFYPKKEKEATSSKSCSAHDAKTVLFTDKVILPVLKRLVISRMGNIIEIWDKQPIAVLEGKGSFCQLTDVSIDNCGKLLLVFPSKMHPQLKNLEKLEVVCCAAMEGIVEFEGEIYEDGLGNEVCFSKLSCLRLTVLPNLVRFCTKLRTAGTTDGNATIHAQPLFNEKVIFPVLEELSIYELDNIIKIWDNQSIVVVEERGSFSQLTKVNVNCCNKLMHVLSSKMHPLLKNLKELEVSYCGTMKSITEFEGEIDEDGLKNEVASPALEHLEMFGAPKITEIQDKQLQLPQPRIKVESLCKLEHIKISACDQLLYVFPSNMLPQNLQRLKIDFCDGLEVIISKELKEKEATNYDIIVFPQLKFVTLQNLPKLKSFYSETQGFFSHKVIFPVLEELTISRLHNIIKIWDNQSIVVVEERGSFCQLTKVNVASCNKLMHVLSSKMHPLLKNLKELQVYNCQTMKSIIEFEGEIDEDGLRNEVASLALEQLEMFGVSKITEIQDKQLLPQPIIKVESLCKLERIVIVECHQLLYVFPSSMLPQNLQQLEIENCDALEVIFSKELKEKEAINYDIIVFPQLKFVKLQHLPKLKSFYIETQGFFSHEVAFPVLKKLVFVNLDKITRIWDNQPLSEPEKANSFCQLMDIFVSRCVHLEYVLPFYMLPQLKNLQELTIWECTKMEVIIISNNPEDQKEATINDTILFPQLKTVRLMELPNLKSLCTETQIFFSNKDAFPVLETIELDPEGTLEFLRNEMASTKDVSMEECGTSGKENDHNGEQG